jgi:hypothetical protein
LLPLSAAAKGVKSLISLRNHSIRSIRK